VQSTLAKLNVRVVILSSAAPGKWQPHDLLLRDAIAGRPDLWRRAGMQQRSSGSKYDIFESIL
jgi:hypothetical protein